MTTIKTKQGNELALETFNGAVYVRTPKGAYKVDTFEYVSGKVSLLGLNGGFILATNRDKMILAEAINRFDDEDDKFMALLDSALQGPGRPLTLQDIGNKYKNSKFPNLSQLDESALDESLAALEGICNGLR